jgi:23S rRNA (uracil1939-C5)-methyltransferase
LSVKQGQVVDALERIGGVSDVEVEPIVEAVAQWRYRNKLEYSFGFGEDGGLVCGFHAPAGWNRVLPLGDCWLASELSNEVRDATLAWCVEQGLTAWERGVGRKRNGAVDGARAGPGADGRARLRNLVVREGRASGVVQVRVVSTPGELDVGSLADALRDRFGERVWGVLWTRSEQLGETTAGGRTELVSGEHQLPERLGDLELRISPEAFFQTNTEMAEKLYEVVASYAGLQGWERVYDLYSGIGTIALTLASRAGEVWGIELVGEAVQDAVAGAERNEIVNVGFLVGDARSGLAELVAQRGRPDVMVVDPPRAGLSKKVVARIVEAGPKRIVYVSCNPTTLAPNVAQLAEEGWRLVKVRPVDMFPQTHHVECVALLERS